MSKWKIIGLAIALFAVTVSLMNASWIAPEPQGRLLLVAHRGVAQQFPREGLGRQDCTATRIRKPEHNYIENTLPSLQRAYFLGANIVEVDVQQTADGQMVAFHDATLECRTNGKGRVRDHSLAQLKTLDAGYGYTADGGKTFPLRGRVGAIPSLDEVLRAAPAQGLLFHFKTRDPSDADALAAAFQRSGLPIHDKVSFYGPQIVLDRMRRHAPKAWMFDPAATKACGTDYVKWGWAGIVPESCRGTTTMVPLNYQWAIWGWPKRFLARMSGVDAKTIVTGPLENKDAPVGIDRPEQLSEVPRSFRGYLWVEDIYSIGPALGR
jgi:glycerophosphoryl diester phosphodiesterase